jgi:TIR domain
LGGEAIPSIFISYRREDTAGEAGRLAEALGAQFGRANVFIDVDTLAPGSDFAHEIEQALADCQLALILIGPQWLTVENPDGTRRIDAEDDFVRKEIASALAQPDVTVIPVLVDGATMPAAAELPDDIASLAKFNAFDLSNKRWQYDVAQLTQYARRYDNRWWRLIYRTPRLALRAVPIVALIIVGLVAVAIANNGPTRADQVEKCEHDHGMSAQTVTRPPQSGESQFTKSSVNPPSYERVVFQPNTYASCSWPPAPGADADGYLSITVTLTNGPGLFSLSGRTYADVIESNCPRLGLQYVEEHMGSQEAWTPFTAARGDIWAPVQGAQTSFVRLTEIGAPTEAGVHLPFYPPVGSIVVLHGDQAIAHITCLKAAPSG